MLRYHNVHEPDSEPGFFDEHRDPITCIATTVSLAALASISATRILELVTKQRLATIVLQSDHRM
jgi:hypothetical protein